MTEIAIIKKVVETLGANPKCKVRYASEIENFHNRKVQAQANRYRLGVIGVTSSGKSTMINSLLGEFLLPAVARPSSSQLVSCYRSAERCAKIYFNDDTCKKFAGAALTQKVIEKYGDEGINQKNKEKVKHIELSSPNFPFSESIILIDSPGLDAYGYEGHEQLTMNSLLPTIDFCIFVTTCKTNSDDKMLSVLNTVAEYEKPLIIVQNMIDSLKPSVDGLKSVKDVAQDHRKRIERIINRSNIKDKSKVHIVQISAINALRARQNKLRRNEDKQLLESSNYNILVAKVEATFNQVRPIVEAHRMQFLKEEIKRIADAALEDGKGSTGIVAKFEYENTEESYKKQKQTCLSLLSDELTKLKNHITSIRYKTNFSDYDVNLLKSQSISCENAICKCMKELNECISGICSKLNIDSRNIISDFRFEKPELRLRKKTEVVKDGYYKKGERHWYTLWLIKDDDEWVDTSYTREVTDVAASKENAINFINSVTRVFQQTIVRWQKSIEVTEGKLFSEIENRQREYKARQQKALDVQIYLKIGNELKNIANTIKVFSANSTNVNSTKTDVKDSIDLKVNVKREILALAKIADIIRINIHRKTAKYFINDSYENFIFGWDEYCETKLAHLAFKSTISATKIAAGRNIVNNNTKIYHKPTSLSGIIRNKNIFILVNATQFGAALTEIAKSKILELINISDNITMVIQDFQEIINGYSVDETLDNMISIRNNKDLSKNVSYKIMLLHDNPLYNLVAAEAQATRCQHQSDEIRIIHDIQTKFLYLLPRSKSERNKVETTIRLIIQKLGKI